MASGAARADVIRLIMWDGARMILSGTAIGILCLVGLTVYCRDCYIRLAA